MNIPENTPCLIHPDLLFGFRCAFLCLLYPAVGHDCRRTDMGRRPLRCRRWRPTVGREWGDPFPTPLAELDLARFWGVLGTEHLLPDFFRPISGSELRQTGAVKSFWPLSRGFAGINFLNMGSRRQVGSLKESHDHTPQSRVLR